MVAVRQADCYPVWGQGAKENCHSHRQSRCFHRPHSLETGESVTWGQSLFLGCLSLLVGAGLSVLCRRC